MAFEAYRRQRRGPTLAKRIVFVLVAAAHGAAIAGGVVYSYWHVDELTPPTLRVTFISAAPPPPPPPPPPAGGGSKPKKVAIKTTPATPVVPKPTDIVQPREKPAPIKKEFRKHDDEEDDEDDAAPKGVKGGKSGGIAGGIEGGEVGGELGGVKGGAQGGVIGGAPMGTGTGARKMLAPNMGKLQWDGCAEPSFPTSLRKVGVSYNTTVKICVTKAGMVESVLVLKHSDSVLDANVVSAMKACRHKPLMANSIAVPYCYIQPFEFQATR